MTDSQKYWFAARVRNSQELSVRKMLVKLGVEHYLPTELVIRELKYRRKQVEVPVIRNLIFIYDTKEGACAIANDFGVQLFYIRDTQTGGMLVIPDKQMNDFMTVMALAHDNVKLIENAWTPGERVQVVNGNLCGIEGELVSHTNRTYVVIRIAHILSARVKIPKAYLRKI